MGIRRKIYNIIELDNRNDSKLDEYYSYFMIIVILLSLLPLFTRDKSFILINIERITLIIFIIDYLLRLITADIKSKKGWKAFLAYPFSFFAIIDLISIIPAFTSLNNGFKALKTFRVIKCFKVFKALRYSKSFMMLLRVFEREKNSLITVFLTSVAYIVISALIMYNAEVENFDTYFDALYWATTALTTVGYGDIYPITELGKWISMFSSFLGIAVVAIPSGIITAGYMKEVNEYHDQREKN